MQKVAVPVEFLKTIATYFQDHCHDETAQVLEFKLDGVVREAEQGARPQALQLEPIWSEDFATAEAMARVLGFTSWAYTTTSGIGACLTCHPSSPAQRGGVIVKAADFGLLFVQDENDLGRALVASKVRA